MVDCKINLNAVRTKRSAPLKWCSIVLKELDNGDYNSELNAVNQAQAVNTDLKLSEITGLKMYFFTGLNAALHVVPCNLSYDMICQKF